MERAGFWRRAFALGIDIAILALVTQLAALVLFPATDGRIQSLSGIKFSSCTTTDVKPANLPLPANLDANRYSECTISFFGIPQARTFTAARVHVSGAVTTTVAAGVPMSPGGELIRAFYLDFAILPLLILMRGFGDWSQLRTLGRRLTRTMVSARNNAGFSLGTSFLRQVVWSAPLLAYSLFSVRGTGPEALEVLQVDGIDGFWRSMPLWIGLGVAVSLYFLANVIMVIRRTDALHDRVASTAVVLSSPLPAINADSALQP